MLLYHKISYQVGSWILEDNSDKSSRYESINIRFDGGLFILLGLSDVTKSKILVIFKDQITSSQYRILMLAGKLGLGIK